MTALVIIGDVMAFGLGGTLVWFCKDDLQRFVIGANALSAKLHAKADALLGKK